MKLKDIIVEDESMSNDSFDTDYTDKMGNDIFDLLVAAKATDVEVIDTDAFLSQLNNMGYELSPESLMGELQNHAMVQDANETEITLKGADVSTDGAKNDANKNRDIVRNCTDHFQNYPLDELQMPAPFANATEFDHTTISDADRQAIRDWCATLNLGGE